MDKKIILSIVIVALIGIVAATYQININDNLLNPLASIETIKITKKEHKTVQLVEVHL